MVRHTGLQARNNFHLRIDMPPSTLRKPINSLPHLRQSLSRLLPRAQYLTKVAFFPLSSKSLGMIQNQLDAGENINLDESLNPLPKSVSRRFSVPNSTQIAKTPVPFVSIVQPLFVMFGILKSGWLVCLCVCDVEGFVGKNRW